jgi:hypothetical protein
MSARKASAAAPCAAMCVCLSLMAPFSAAEEPTGWRPLFNGKDLDGWDTFLGKPGKHVEGLDLKRDAKGEYAEPLGVNRDPTKVYSVVEIDGKPAIRISGEVFGALTSREEFGNYHLRFEVKWGEKRWPPREKVARDSGLLYHCVGPHGAGSGFWMRSFESQIQENDFGDFHSVAGVLVDVEGDVKRAKRKDPKTGEEREFIQSVTFRKGGEKVAGWSRQIIRNPVSEKPRGEWNVVELYAVGGTAVHVNNGVANMVLTNLSMRDKDGKVVPLTRGKIQLQSEGAEVYYRNIEIRPITEIPPELLK